MEEINILKTRSFLLMVGVFVTIVMQIFGVTVPGIEFLVDPETFTEFLMPAIPGVLGVLAYLERIFGKKKIVFKFKSSRKEEE